MEVALSEDELIVLPVIHCVLFLCILALGSGPAKFHPHHQQDLAGDPGNFHIEGHSDNRPFSTAQLSVDKRKKNVSKKAPLFHVKCLRQ